jgi:drug/metabolite transporter (DMT)-like permease
LNLVPATTALVAVPVLGEPLTVRAILGLAVALVGMYVGLGLQQRRNGPDRSRGLADLPDRVDRKLGSPNAETHHE